MLIIDQQETYIVRSKGAREDKNIYLRFDSIDSPGIDSLIHL
jgi:hypothetical protein